MTMPILTWKGMISSSMHFTHSACLPGRTTYCRSSKNIGGLLCGAAPIVVPSWARIAGAMLIEIICTGDEVLTGKIVNSNFSYMAQKLEDFGLSVSWGTTAADVREEWLAAFRRSADPAEPATAIGGPGPPVNDRSQGVPPPAPGAEP